MIITASEFENSGLPVSTDIRNEEIEIAIQTVELTYLKPLITSDYYKTITTSTLSDDDYNVVNGDGVVAGLKFALYHAVFAYLMWDRMHLTRFTSVIKDDEHSTEPDTSDLMSICQSHWEIGITAVIDTLLAYGHEPCVEITPQPPFCELAFPYYTPKHKR